MRTPMHTCRCMHLHMHTCTHAHAHAHMHMLHTDPGSPTTPTTPTCMPPQHRYPIRRSEIKLGQSHPAETLHAQLARPP